MHFDQLPAPEQLHQRGVGPHIHMRSNVVFRGRVQRLPDLDLLTEPPTLFSLVSDHFLVASLG
jgi:hypothetical protein